MRDGLLPRENVMRRTEDEIRRVKWGLINAIPAGGAQSTRGNFILVTSAIPGEGKTFMSLNLALSAARERERKGHWRSPSASAFWERC